MSTQKPRYFLSWHEPSPEDWNDAWYDDLDDAQAAYDELERPWKLLERVEGEDYTTVCETP